MRPGLPSSSGSGTGAPGATPRSLPAPRTSTSGSRLSAAVPLSPGTLRPSALSATGTSCAGSGGGSQALPAIEISSARDLPAVMLCRRSVAPRRDEWRSTIMRAASDAAERFTLPAPPLPGGWRSGAMRMLDAAITPGTIPNVAVTLAVTVLVIPRIPNKVLAAAAGFAAGSILGGNLATLRPPALSPRR